MRQSEKSSFPRSKVGEQRKLAQTLHYDEGFRGAGHDLGAALHVGVQQPVDDEQRPFDPSDFT